ncbi:MAG: hypothetical protein EHM28_05295 [Spirochaetaceae bacterium]|nr:MAG: hypothetical protein EHM28_05295 [Spirochaetaceae bacterium]
MVLDFERYSSRRDRKTKRVIFRIGAIIFFFVLLFFLGNLFGLWTFISSIFTSSAKTDEDLSLEFLWSRVSWKQLLDESEGFPSSETPSIDKALDDARKTIRRWSILLLNTEIGQCNTILENNPLDIQALVYRGSSYFYLAITNPKTDESEGALEQALISFRKAILSGASGQNPELYYMIGKCYFHKAKTRLEAQNWFYSMSIKYLEKSMELGYKGSDSYEYLAIANDEAGNIDASIEYLLQANALEQKDRYLFRLAKNYAHKGDSVRAKEYLEQTLEISRNDKILNDARFLFGEILFGEQDYRKAEALYKDILKNNDRSAEAHFRLALVYEKLGDYAQYRYELRRTLENDPSHSGARNRL